MSNPNRTAPPIRDPLTPNEQSLELLISWLRDDLWAAERWNRFYAAVALTMVITNGVVWLGLWRMGCQLASAP